MGAIYWTKTFTGKTLKELKKKWKIFALQNRKKLLDIVLAEVAKENQDEYCKYHSKRCHKKHVQFDASHVYKSSKTKLSNEPSHVVRHGVIFKGRDHQYYEATKHGKWKRVTLKNKHVNNWLTYCGQPFLWNRVYRGHTKGKLNEWSPFSSGFFKNSYAIDIQLSKTFSTVKAANTYILENNKKWDSGIAVRVGKNKIVVGGYCAD